MSSLLRVGLIGAGANTRSRHIPGLRAVEGVSIDAVCNRRPESTRAVAEEFGIARTCERWEEVVADPALDAIVIGTWPYLHAPITVAALEAGKHVLTEARMAMNAAEAGRMLAAAQARPDLVAQVVPSPFGLKGLEVVRDLLSAGFVGALREVVVVHRHDGLADPAAPLHWRQDAALSGCNMLTLGILHETLLRWVPAPRQVVAEAHAFIPVRNDPVSGVHRQVGTPDAVQVLATLPGGARATYQLSGVAPFGQEMSITILGSEGAVHYDLTADRLRGASRVRGDKPCRLDALPELPMPEEKVRGWRVEADFVESIRTGKPVELTDFESGVAYMEFTEAVARSAAAGGVPVALPLA